MSLNLLVQACLVSDGAIPTIEAAKQTRFSLHANVVFLDGKKIGALRTLDQASFDQLDAHLTWSPGPSVVVGFPDSKSAETLKASIDATQRRALNSPSVGNAPARIAQLAVRESSKVLTPARDDRRRPVYDSHGSAEKRRAKATPECKHDDKAEAQGFDQETPVNPIVDSTLTENDRQKRRRLAAVCAEERASQIQMRGIGDEHCAQRMQERAEREELVGRLTERYTLLRKEVPWNFGGVPIAELRARFQSLSKGIIP
eukprot:CAMPEP_0172897144 /NCGR_PEP_ID=MMETSP1075-20121228/156888_1 /TAXON_ID=2916 /ORGANISM="Ceratium fusus, Strain PA161109" /LENGTH=257 /DNA_ID=CAMNT_0013752649 /DNA_START=11 /DNA_END=784 /DNA_ORIENTATION=-